MASIIQRVRDSIARHIDRKKEALYQLIYKRLPLYYTSLNRIPFFNWWEVQNGKVEYLNRFNLKVRLPFLYDVYRDMLFQFDKLELNGIRKIAEYELLKSMAVITGDEMLEFEAGLIKAEIEQDEKKTTENNMSMNDFIDYIELTLEKPGSIDPNKMSAGRVYSLHNRAKEINLKRKQNKRKHGKYN